MSYSTVRLPTGLAEQVRWAGERVARTGHSVLDLPVAEVPCELVLTAKKGSNGKVLVVRCLCMAQTRNKPSRTYWWYDPVGEASDLQGALALWREHRDGRSAEHERTHRCA